MFPRNFGAYHVQVKALSVNIETAMVTSNTMSAPTGND